LRPAARPTREATHLRPAGGTGVSAGRRDRPIPTGAPAAEAAPAGRHLEGRARQRQRANESSRLSRDPRGRRSPPRPRRRHGRARRAAYGRPGGGGRLEGPGSRPRTGAGPAPRGLAAGGADRKEARAAEKVMSKKLYIETVGCQMNVLDSELVVGS